jgi:hypothetical protein
MYAGDESYDDEVTSGPIEPSPPLAARVAVAFGEWPPSCGELDTYRDGPCRRRRGHDGNHSAVGCEAGC